MLRTVSESLHGLIHHAAAQAIQADLLIRAMTRHFHGKLGLGTIPSHGVGTGTGHGNLLHLTAPHCVAAACVSSSA